MKVRVSYLLDLQQLAPEAQTVEEAQEVVRSMGWAAARLSHKDAVHRYRMDQSIPDPEKHVLMAQHLRGLMFTLMGEANTVVELVDPSTPVSTELPFERKYQGD